MKLIPSAQYEIRTRLSPEEVCAALKANTAAAESPLTKNQFLGTVGTTAFCIHSHNPNLKIPFKPELWGRICEDGGGSIVRVEAKLPPIVWIIPALLLALGLIFGVYGLLLLIPLYLVLCNMGFPLAEEEARRRLTRIIAQ